VDAYVIVSVGFGSRIETPAGWSFTRSVRISF